MNPAAKQTASTPLLAELRIPAQADRLALVRNCVRSAAKLGGCDDEAADNIVLAVNEACMNVIQHGYCFTADQELLLRVHKENDALVFELLDHAAPVQVDKVKSRPLEEIRPGGLGVHFIQSIMDEMTFCEAPAGFGNLLRMVKKTGGGKTHGT
jgi:anti-sigma regulatory factor (Ser/Thr protein kinase)